MDKGQEKGASGFGGLTDDESTHGAIGVAASEAGLMGVLINSKPVTFEILMTCPGRVYSS